MSFIRILWSVIVIIWAITECIHFVVLCMSWKLSMELFVAHVAIAWLVYKNVVNTAPSNVNTKYVKYNTDTNEGES